MSIEMVGAHSEISGNVEILGTTAMSLGRIGVASVKL